MTSTIQETQPRTSDTVSPDGRRRVVIDAVRPQVDGGLYPIKRILGDRVVVETDVLVDGHDHLAGVLLYRQRGSSAWLEEPLAPFHPHHRPASPAPARPQPQPQPQPQMDVKGQAQRQSPQAVEATQPVDDRWMATFVVDALGFWEYTVRAWVDPWATWAWGLRRKLAAQQNVDLELRAGAALLLAAAARATETDRSALVRLGERIGGDEEPLSRANLSLAPDTQELMRAHADRSMATTRQPPLAVLVERRRAEFSSWYEFFPRSCGVDGRHGTFRDAERRLPDIADMGFDIVYLPPIHPIGRTHRKGPDNSLTASASDPGSPWAIGAQEGGHKAIHPELGTLEDFRHFLGAAREHGLEVALDIALQTSPDHPYVKEHPEWFVHRPDGTIQFAENPPKKYQDIYPFDFGGPAWETLWQEARSIFLYWIEQGVRVFRVDNPHTKPLPFWQWCLGTIKETYPEVIFLAEAFTRPKVMHALAKAGFSQSYTYFTWRTTKAELTTYLRSLVDTDVKEFFRPNFWPNTPDILPEQLQLGTRATFVARAVLAATLSPSWGVYGPAYELQEHIARDGSEEYAQNEKYQLRVWELGRPDSLRAMLRRLNQVRRDNPALHRLAGTVFHETDSDSLICFSRADEGAANVIVVVVNLDPHNRQAGWINLDLAALGLGEQPRFQVHDLISDARFLWSGARVFVSLDPQVMPAHILRVRRHVHTERTFEYFL